MSARLELAGVTKRYGHGRRRQAVLDGVDLDVEGGRTLVLLGPSGSGKTTLLRIVAGLGRPDAGTVRVGERVVAGEGVHVRPEARRVGMVFQALELWPHMTAAEHVAFGLPGRPRGGRAVRDPVVADLAARVGLDEGHLRRTPETLSGGERQRVAIARALAADPAVLLYDEPLANLDPDRRGSLRRLIRDLATERGTTLLYVTHDAEEALALGHEIAVLVRGRLVERGPPETLYARPRTVAAARALGPVTLLPAEVEGDRATTCLGTVPLPAATPGTGALAARHAAGARAQVALRPEQVVFGEGGVEVVVDEARLQAGRWVVRGTRDGTVVLGEARERPALGAPLAARVRDGARASLVEADGQGAVVEAAS